MDKEAKTKWGRNPKTAKAEAQLRKAADSGSPEPTAPIKPSEEPSTEPEPES